MFEGCLTNRDFDRRLSLPGAKMAMFSQLINKENLISDLANLSIRYKIDPSVLTDFAMRFERAVTSEIERKSSEKTKRNSIPDRNRLILKRQLDGVTRRKISEEFSLALDSIAGIIKSEKITVSTRVFERKSTVEKIAQEYDLSPNQIMDLTVKSITSNRDQLVEWLATENMESGSREHDIDKLRDMTNFLSDGEFVDFVIKESFDDLVDIAAISDIVNSPKTIIWTVLPALVITSDGTFCVMSAEEAYELARSAGGDGFEIMFNGQVVNRITYINGETIWAAWCS